MNFLEFFVWGAWLISLGGYLIGVLKFSGGQVGAIYGTNKRSKWKDYLCQK
jgi:NHS family xanthosine MFS transporter